MRIGLIGAIAGVVGVIATPVMADWQYTKWGMTLDEVVAAAPADTESRIGKLSTGEDLVIGKYRAGPYTFESRVLFGDSGARSVELMPADSVSCSDLEHSIEQSYGPHADTSGIGGSVTTPWIEFTKWVDVKKGNLIYIYFGPGGATCKLAYRPIPTPPQKVDGL